MKLPRIRLAIRHHPRLTMGTIIATVFVVIGAYGLWSVNVWSQYEVSYERWERDLHTDIDSGFALPVKNAQDRLRKLAAFKDISSDITSARESLCTVHGMFRWQDIIPALKTREEACTQIVEAADGLEVALHSATDYFSSEQALTKIIVSVSTSPDKLTEATWEARVVVWHTGVDTIKKLSANEVFAPVKKSAIESMQGVEAAWRGLVDAHKAKDKAKYMEAQVLLARAYEGLGAIASTDNQQVTVLVSSLQVAYTRAFAV